MQSPPEIIHFKNNPALPLEIEFEWWPPYNGSFLHLKQHNPAKIINKSVFFILAA